MSKKIQLAIADPCHENWDKMTKVEQGRFCASCQKQVVDFTKMSDSQLATFFKKPLEGSVCGRFFQDQLERDIEIPRKRIPWVKYFFQFALPAFLVSMKATAQGNAIVVRQKPDSKSQPVCLPVLGGLSRIKRPPLMADALLAPVQKQNENTVLLQGKPKIDIQPVSFLVSIKGIVENENNEPVPFATIMIKGTKIGTMADSIGVFELKEIPLQAGLSLVVTSVGYEPKELQVGNVAVSDEIVIHLTKQVMREVVVVAYGSVTRRTVTGASSVKIQKNNNSSIAQHPTELPPMIKVYPNPVVAGTNINIGCQKLEEGYYSIQLVTQAGQQVLNKQTWIDGEVQVLNIDIPNVASGIYFLKLTNKETNKRFTQKVVIE